MENPTPANAPETSPLPADLPLPEPGSEAAPAAAENLAEKSETGSGAEGDPLAALATAAKAARLKPADEERATELLKQRLAGGKAGITAAVSAMTDGLPWVVSVNAVSAVWESLSSPMRRHLLASVAKIETVPARRLRMSLARAVFKLDPPAGIKLAAAAAAALKDAETGSLCAKHRQYFFNIFIGKGKPWLLQLPLGDLKPAEADALVHAAIETFSFCPPLSQLSILRWAHGAGRFKKIGAGDLAVVAKALSRWNVKLQRQLKAEIAELPAELEAALKPEALQPPPEATEAPKPAAKAQPEGKKSAQPPRAAKAAEAKTAEPAAEAPEGEPPTAPEPQGEAVAPEPPEELVIPGRAERLARKAERKTEAKANRREPEPERRKPEELRRPDRGEKEGRSSFDVKEALRGVEAYIATLRNELEQTKAQVRRQEKDERRSRPSARNAEPVPPEELAALTRHNIRLEATVAELRAQLEDLASHHEAVAESRLLHTGEPIAEGGAEALKSLLSIKLQEAFETYHAMRLEPLDKVFRLDYRDLLGSVFDVLMEQGVTLKKQGKNS